MTFINFTQPVNGYKDTFIFIGLLLKYVSLEKDQIGTFPLLFTVEIFVYETCS